jgi:heme oxygenase (biliverdin-IX-beta and delta-forming)
MSPTPPVHRAVNDATRTLHRRAEQHVRILDPDAWVDDHARYLRAMYGFHAPIEHALAADTALEAAGFAAAQRWNSPWLIQDLRRLDPCSPDPPCCDALPPGGSVARRIGISCVIERSTLGGKYVLAHLIAWLARFERRAAEAP